MVTRVEKPLFKLEENSFTMTTNNVLLQEITKKLEKLNIDKKNINAINENSESESKITNINATNINKLNSKNFSTGRTYHKTKNYYPPSFPDTQFEETREQVLSYFLLFVFPFYK